MTDPAHYDFAGTRAMSVINPVSPELSETPTLEKGDIKKDMEEATPADPPAPSVRHGLVTAEYRMDIPVEQLQRNFKRAAWLSLALTLIVTIVSCPYSRCKEFIGLTIRAGYTIADVFFPLCVFPNVLPLLDNLLHGEFFFVFFGGGGGLCLDCFLITTVPLDLGAIRGHILHPSPLLGVQSTNRYYLVRLSLIFRAKGRQKMGKQHGRRDVMRHTIPKI
jgi:hypothetical protein